MNKKVIDEIGALFVVDDPAKILSITKELIVNGIIPVTANNEFDVIQYALGGQNRIVLLDVMLPKNQGLDILKWLRWQEQAKHMSAIPVIMFSDNIDDSTHKQAVEKGALNYVISQTETPELTAQKIKMILAQEAAT